MRSACTIITDLDTSKRVPQPRSKHEGWAASEWVTRTVPAADSMCCARLGWEIHFLFTFETAPFFCVYHVPPHFLDLGSSWRWVVSFTCLPLCPRGKNPGTHCLGGWLGLRAGLDNMVKWKFLTPPRLEIRHLDSLARSQSLYRLHYRCSV
jgi:hypothetical protein